MAKKRSVVLVTAVLMAVAGLVMASPAAAFETDTAVSANPPLEIGNHESSVCKTMTGAAACFQKYGDVLWVEDTASNGASASVYWENYLWNGSSWVFWRQGKCVNSLGNLHWGKCDKDFYEDSTLNPLGSRGSGIRVYPCNGNDCSGSYLWLRNNA